MNPEVQRYNIEKQAEIRRQEHMEQQRLAAMGKLVLVELLRASKNG